MVGYTSDVDTTGRLLFKCIYCNKCRTETGHWEQSKALDTLLSHKDTSHGICPMCFHKYFPEEFSSLCQEGVITIHKTISSDDQVTYEIFYKTDENGKEDVFGKYTN